MKNTDESFNQIIITLWGCFIGTILSLLILNMFASRQLDTIDYRLNHLQENQREHKIYFESDILIREYYGCNSILDSTVILTPAEEVIMKVK